MKMNQVSLGRRISLGLSIALGMFALSSCSKEVDLPYEPIRHDNTSWPELRLVVQDEQGKDLLKDSNFVKSISVFGWERKANTYLSVERPMVKDYFTSYEDSSKFRTLNIHLDLPNVYKHRNYKTGDTVNVVTTLRSSLGNLDFYATYVLIEPPKTVIYGNSLIGMKFLKIGQYPTPPEGYEEDRRITLTYKGGALVPSQK